MFTIWEHLIFGFKTFLSSAFIINLPPSNEILRTVRALSILELFTDVLFISDIFNFCLLLY
jgi:hypothetical protein